MRCDDEHITGVPLRFEVNGCEIRTLVSSGDDVAFHARQHGRYLGGFGGLEEAKSGTASHLQCNGIVNVASGHVRAGRVIRDRLGLRARLQGA